MSATQDELPIVQQTYDLIKWYIPILNRLPRDHKFGLGQRMVSELYELLEGLVLARYDRDRLAKLQPLSGKLDVLQYQTRLLFDFQLIALNRYQYASDRINEIGKQLSGWISQQRSRA